MANVTSGSGAAVTAATHINSVEEQHLLFRITQGDLSAFWQLWDMYRDELLSCPSLQWMRGVDAEDALSSSSVKACQYLLNAPREIIHVKAWFTRLLRNHCIDIWKTHQRHHQYLQDVATPLTGGQQTAPFVQASVEDVLLQHELAAQIRHAIDQLPPQLREPSLLRFVYEMSYEDIAAQLHLHADNVRKRIQKARPLLQQQLAAYRSAEPIAPGDTAHAPPLPLTTPSHEPYPKEEIAPLHVRAHACRVFLPEGVEKHLCLNLDHKPQRQEQKASTLQKYVDEHPNGWKKRHALADIRYTMGQWEEAIAAYRDVIRRHPRCLTAWLRLGEMLHILDRQDEAIAAYEQALSVSDNQATQNHIEGFIAVCRRQPHTAVQAFEAATISAPDHPAHWRSLALTHLHAAQPREALEAFDTVLQHHPDDLVALVHSHDALRTAGYDAEAQRRAARALELDPDNVWALVHVANRLTHIECGRGTTGQTCRKRLRHALQLAPNAPEVHASRARYRMSRGKWEQALEMLREFTVQHPKSPMGWYYAAQWHFRAGHTEAASHAIRQAYALDSHDAAILRAACQILTATGEVAELKPILDDLLRGFPDHWSTWTTAGYVRLQAYGENTHACDASAYGPQLQPSLAQAWFRHGYVLALAGRHREATAALETGWTYLPEADGYHHSVPAAVQLGQSYEALGNTAGARQWCTQALHLSQQLMTANPARAHYWQGRAYIVLSQTERAREAFRSALRHHLFYPARQEAQDFLDLSPANPFPPPGIKEKETSAF